MNAGFFGKMPGHGDFVERGLPGAFKDRWDEWLQHGIAASKAAIGDAWLDAYLTSPVWRFALAPGIGGESGWVGVLVPSVDRVGRYFPLTVAASVEANAIPLQMMVAAAEWHDAAQDAALLALHDEQVDADVLVQKLQPLGGSVFGQPPIYCPRPERDPREALHAHALRMPFSYGTTPGHGLLAFSHRMLEALFGQHYSIWWTHGSERVQPGMFACASLPSADAFAGMLVDQAMAPGWISLPGYEMPDGAAGQPQDPDPEPAATGPLPVDEQVDVPADAPAASSSLIPDDRSDDEITLVPGIDQKPAAATPSDPEESGGSLIPPETDPPAESSSKEASTSFDDLIVEASADEASADEGSGDDFDAGADEAPGPPAPIGTDGPEPVQVSSDDILAGFGEAPGETEAEQIEDQSVDEDETPERAGDAKS